MSPVSFSVAGEPVSYATPRQMQFIAWLAETTHLVPVTARSRDALRRVRLPFASAVCAHGGMILDDEGEPDAEWHGHIAQQAAGLAETMESLVAGLRDAAGAAGLAVKARVQMEGEIGLYPLARHESGDEAALNAVADAVCGQLPPGWTDHRNSNAVAFLPPFLGKEKAVDRILPGLRARYPDATVIGLGDSITDAPFMARCDFAMIPAGSQLARAVRDGLSGS